MNHDNTLKGAEGSLKHAREPSVTKYLDEIYESYVNSQEKAMEYNGSIYLKAKGNLKSRLEKRLF